MIRLLTILAISTSLFGCNPKPNNQPTNLLQENLVLATIWYQNSPEARALYFQGFNIAKERVMEYKKMKSDKPKAVVVDLDETMIDNSPFQGRMIETGSPFTIELWDEWVNKQEANATPGAVEFTQFCQAIGVEVIYLSNRTISQLDATIANMKKLGFAFLEPTNFYLKETTSQKEPRRLEVSEKFDIILLLGDNLNDFAECFEKRESDWGHSVTEQFREEFGRRFIVFPNPLYGEWEKNVYGNQRVTEEQLKFKMRREAIKSF